MSASLLAGLTMLVIGESHLTLPGYLIDTLHDDLTKKGAVVHSIGACGANAADWLKTLPVACGADRVGAAPAVIKGRDAKTTPIQALIAADKPDVVVIIIGDTMASYDKEVFPKTWAWQSVTSLTKAVAATKTQCVWVGPPWGTAGGKYFKNDTRVKLMSNFLANNVAPCTYIDSLSLSKPGEWSTTDGQHLTFAGYQAWGNGIAQALEQSPALKTWKKP